MNAERGRLGRASMCASPDYITRLTEDAQVEFKGKAKAFLRAYGFLSSILLYTNARRDRRRHRAIAGARATCAPWTNARWVDLRHGDA